MSFFELEPVYVVGTHDDFMAGIDRRLVEVSREGDGGKVHVDQFSHAIAVAPDGQMHWSALLSGSVARR